MAVVVVGFAAALFCENRNHRMSGGLDLSKTELQGFISSVSGQCADQSGSSVHQLFCAISDYTSSTLGFVFRGLDLVGGSVDFSTLSDAETKSIFVFVCAERSFLWNRVVRVMGL